MTATDNSLAHNRRECKYQVVFIPKYRKKVMFQDLKNLLGVWFRELALQKEFQIPEGHVMPDHVQMLIAIPPRYSVSQVIGYHQGKKCNPDCADVLRKTAELLRSAFSNSRLLCEHCRKR